MPDQDLRVVAQLIDHAQRWKQLFATPQCLWHSDLRADNVMFDAAAGQRPVVILDWQGLGYGLGTIDVAYWLGTSMATSARRSHERALVDHDHAALIGHGVRDYSRERCWNDYRRNAIHGLQIGVFGLGAVKRSPRGDRMWQNRIAAPPPRSVISIATPSLNVRAETDGAAGEARTGSAGDTSHFAGEAVHEKHRALAVIGSQALRSNTSSVELAVA
ncbi:MAG: phosphotransferase [Gammaproteobacteria bacterium]|nr:phosphotransferase [Gammaproteobacteria bacterium]